MIELAHFIHFFGFSIGLLAIYMARGLYKQSQWKALRHYKRFLIGVNLIVFAHILEAFLKTILSAQVYDDYFRLPFLILIAPFGLLRLYMALQFLKAIYKVQKKTLPKTFGYAALIHYLLFLAIWFIPALNEGWKWSHATLVFSIHIALNAALIYGSIRMLRFQDQIRGIRPKFIRPTAWFFLSYATANFLLRLICYPYYRIHEDLQMLGLGIIVLAFFLGNALYLRKVQVKSSTGTTDHKIDPASFERFGMTTREQEIIQLICQGKTNKEIGNILFISPITARDHCSNIYRKAGVKSRTQLAALFSNPEFRNENASSKEDLERG